MFGSDSNRNLKSAKSRPTGNFHSDQIKHLRSRSYSALPNKMRTKSNSNPSVTSDFNHSTNFKNVSKNYNCNNNYNQYNSKSFACTTRPDSFQTSASMSRSNTLTNWKNYYNMSNLPTRNSAREINYTNCNNYNNCNNNGSIPHTYNVYGYAQNESKLSSNHIFKNEEKTIISSSYIHSNHSPQKVDEIEFQDQNQDQFKHDKTYSNNSNMNTRSNKMDLDNRNLEDNATVNETGISQLNIGHELMQPYVDQYEERIPHSIQSYVREMSRGRDHSWDLNVANRGTHSAGNNRFNVQYSKTVDSSKVFFKVHMNLSKYKNKFSYSDKKEKEKEKEQ